MAHYETNRQVIHLSKAKRCLDQAGHLYLHRISLTCVTNEKGGDQTDRDPSSRKQNGISARRASSIFRSTRISSQAGVTIAEIQDVMRRAEGGTAAGALFPQTRRSRLRNIAATSAISHGVDVDKFNAMFFAGLPADTAEYIQASSRIGKRHPCRPRALRSPRRTAAETGYVVETHDQFHRFLERMIPPPARSALGRPAQSAE